MPSLLWIVPLALVAWVWLTSRTFDARIQAARRACGPVARVEQRGQMRMRQGGPWLPFRATQAIGVERTAFVWDARFRMPLGITLRVVDALGPDGGWLEARLFGAIPVAMTRGPEVTRGQVQRYLAELPWCPRAFAVNSGITIEHPASDRLRVQASCDGAEGTVELELGDSGEVVGAQATRPRATQTGSVDTLWVGRFADPAAFGDTSVPTYGEVGWILQGEEFIYWRARITAFHAT